jgi:hypothetical protein
MDEVHSIERYPEGVSDANKAKARELAEKMGAVTSYLDDATLVSSVWEGLGAVSRIMPWDPIGTWDLGPTTCRDRRSGGQLGGKNTARNSIQDESPSCAAADVLASQTVGTVMNIHVH